MINLQFTTITDRIRNKIRNGNWFPKYDHEKSKGHLDACDVHNARKNPTDTPAHKALLTLNEKNRKELDLKFRNVHAVIKHNRPISDYVWLNELDEAKSLDHGETYNNRFSGTLFLENISRVEKDNLQKLIGDINFFSLTMDGSTDDSITEQESLFLFLLVLQDHASLLPCYWRHPSQSLLVYPCPYIYHYLSFGQ
jgi:hypothetical protein